VSVGASYDYAALGCTHHCPGDIALMTTIPGMNIIVPGCQNDFNTLFKKAYKSKKANYFRLTEHSHSLSVEVEFGLGKKIKDGSLGTIIAIGPMLERVVNACEKIDVTILYYTTIIPFDAELLRNNIKNCKVVVIEPYYEGSITHLISKALIGIAVSILSIGVPREFILSYGSSKECDSSLKLNESDIFIRLNQFLNS